MSKTTLAILLVLSLGMILGFCLREGIPKAYAASISTTTRSINGATCVIATTANGQGGSSIGVSCFKK